MDPLYRFVPPSDEKPIDVWYEDPRMTARPYPKPKPMLITNNDKLMDTSDWFFNMESLPCGASIKETYYGIRIVVSIFSGMPRRHLIHFLLIFISYVLVVLTGAVQLELVDTFFSRAVGLLLAVLLLLRAENAVARRQELMEGVLDMMNSAGNLLFLFQFNPESRRKVLDILEFIFLDIAAWAMPASRRRSTKPDGWINCENGELEYLPEEYRETLFMLRAKHGAKISPRPLLLWLRDLCDDLFDPDLACQSAPEKVDKISIIQRFHQNTEREIRTLLAKFDFLLTFRESFVTDQFRWVLETAIFVYVVLYPWCVCNESKVVLGATTLGMACVFYGLNSLTEQLEDPLRQTQSFDLTRTFRNHFRELERDANMREFATDWLRDYEKLGVKACQRLHNKLERFFVRAPRNQVYPNGKAAGYCEAV